MPTTRRQPTSNHTQSTNPADHLGLMISEAARFARLRRTFSREPNAAPEDYLGEAALAVMRACKSFKPKLGFRVSSYAVRAIRNGLIRTSMREDGGQPKGRKKVCVEPMEYDDGHPRFWYKDDSLAAAGDRDEREDWHDRFRMVLSCFPERDRSIMESLLRGDSITTISERVGLTRQRVDQVIRRMRTHPGFLRLACELVERER